MEPDVFWSYVFTTEPFLHLLAIVPESLTPERVALRLPVRPELTNHAHFLHAGAQYTLGEATATAAAGLLFQDIITEVTIVTAIATITYQHASRGDGDMVALVERSASEVRQVRHLFETQRRVRVLSHVQLSDSGVHTAAREPVTVMTVESVVRAARP